MKLDAQTSAKQELTQHKTILSLYITWLGTFRNSAIPDVMSELRSVVIHVNHIDHNVNWVFYLVAIQVHRMGSQLNNTQTNHLDCRTVQVRMIQRKNKATRKEIEVIMCPTQMCDTHSSHIKSFEFSVFLW